MPVSRRPTMRYTSALLAAALALPSAVLAGQVPVVNGIIGDVPNGATKASKVKQALVREDATNVSSAISSQPTAGALRVVENSGVCGAFILLPISLALASRR